MSLPAPPKSSGISWGKVAIIAAATFVVGVGIGIVASPGDDSQPVSELGGDPSPTSATGATSSLPPAEGVTGGTGGTGGTGSVSPTGVGESPDHPIPTGQPAEVGVWSVEVVGLTKNADSAVERENQFNERPKAGNQYVMVTLRTTFNGNGSSDPFFGLTWAAVSEDGTLYESADGVLPKDLSNVGNVPSGVSGVGNILVEVRKEDVDSIVLYIEGETASFDTEGAYLALD